MANIYFVMTKAVATRLYSYIFLVYIIELLKTPPVNRQSCSFYFERKYVIQNVPIFRPNENGNKEDCKICQSCLVFF